jgi:hypothetical protein
MVRKAYSGQRIGNDLYFLKILLRHWKFTLRKIAYV